MLPVSVKCWAAPPFLDMPVYQGVILVRVDFLTSYTVALQRLSESYCEFSVQCQLSSGIDCAVSVTNCCGISF